MSKHSTPTDDLDAALREAVAARDAAHRAWVTAASRPAPGGAHAVVICDGAGWHQRGGELKTPDNITLLTQPPYSPELNPMENVWAYLRQNKLCALVGNSYEAIIDACGNAWNWLIGDPARIRSIGTRDWAVC